MEKEREREGEGREGGREGGKERVKHTHTHKISTQISKGQSSRYHKYLWIGDSLPDRKRYVQPQSFITNAY